MEFNHDFNDYYQVKDPINIVLMMQITRKKLLFSRFLNFGANLLSIFKKNELCLEDLKEKKSINFSGFKKLFSQLTRRKDEKSTK